MFDQYIDALGSIVRQAEASDRNGDSLLLDTVIDRMHREMRSAHDRGNKIIFLGNGGSAGICSHMAIDFSKNGGLRAIALNDGAALTCLANDYGYEHVFAKQLEWHAQSGDIVVAISSSGKSPNILNAAEAARQCGCTVYTLTGFRPDNALRQLGDVNLYLRSDEYGFVEVGHLAILHGTLDLAMGWRAREDGQAA